MRSSAGMYFDKLDHVRAVAAFLVFSWHFVHLSGVPYGYAPLFPPASIFEEGYTGVSLFMTLSGYLFAKLTFGIPISYPRFLWNRLIRLAPLLLFVLAALAMIRVYEGRELPSVARYLSGLILPIFPNGGWSITVELHFYLILPLLLYFVARNAAYGVWLICAAILLRTLIYLELGSVQSLAYWTIVGRFDQFMIGILAYILSRKYALAPLWTLGGAVVFLLFYQAVNQLGGFYGLGGYPSPSPIWICMTTAEGLFYALLIVAYEQARWRPPAMLGKCLAIAGQASYSIYLLHYFVVGRAADLMGSYLPTERYAVAFLASLVAFACFTPVAWLSFKIIESPFLRLRMDYRRPPAAIESAVPGMAAAR